MAKKKAQKKKLQDTQRPVRQKSAADEAMSYAKSLAIALAMALLLKHFVIEAYRIPTGSMEDTILVGDFLIANKFIYGSRIPFTDIRFGGIRDPKQGEIVIFKYPLNPSQNYVKRCIAVPGDILEIKNKVIYVNGVRFEDEGFTKFDDGDHIQPKGSPHFVRDNYGPYRVPEDSFFMMGDNRDNSNDSRYWGVVPRDNILGKALFLHWSWNDDPNAPYIDWTNPFTIAHSMAYNFMHFYKRVRWDRLGRGVT